LYERLKILGLLRLDGSDDNVFTSLLGGAGLHQARDKTCLHRVRNQEKSQAAHPNACSLPLALAGGVVLD